MPRLDETRMAPAGRAASNNSGEGSDWMRRHAETADPESGSNVRASRVEDDWERRHGRCPRST